MFTASITALTPPFRNGEIDRDAFGKPVEWQIDSGTRGLVPRCTTG
ncbi:MAG: dihydrodipicolinate synthase family protein [Micavibrio sp.]